MSDPDVHPPSLPLQTIGCTKPGPLNGDVDHQQEREFTANCSKEGSIRHGNQGSTPAASFRSQADFPGCRQRTGPLTMFYSGRAMVYDDVPAEKARAILVLASGGKSWSTRLVSESSMPVFASPCASGDEKTAAATDPAARDHDSGVSFNNVPASCPPLLNGRKVPFVKRSDAELPFARKVSLARFLEKRKDRIRANLIAKPANVNEKKEIDSASDSTSISKRICTRPPSPSLPHNQDA